MFSFLVLSPFLSFLLSSFLEGGNKYVLSCVIQHEAGDLSKNVFITTFQKRRKEKKGEERRKEGEKRKEKGVPDRGNTKQPVGETILRK